MAEAAFRTRSAQIADVPRAATLRVSGRATVDEAPELREQILAEIDAIESAGATRLVVELGGVDEMDTAGAAVLIEGLRRAWQRGIRLLLCSPSESVVRMFQLAGLENVLDYSCANPAETRRRLLALPGGGA
jgi:anti-anti-sigma factor